MSHLITNFCDCRSRNIGKTYINATWAKSFGATYVTINAAEAKRIQQEFGIKRVLTIDEVRRGKLLGKHNPTVYDPECIVRIEMDLSSVKEKNEKLEKRINTLEWNSGVLKTDTKELKEENKNLESLKDRVKEMSTKYAGCEILMREFPELFGE